MSTRHNRSENEEPEPTPDILRYRPVSHGDLSMVNSLAARLKESGALEKDEPESGLRPEGTFNEIFWEAAVHGKAEEELNPEFYSPEAEAIAAKGSADWENPSLDGVDDFGEQAYPDSSTLTRENRARLQAEEDELAPWERPEMPEV